MSVKSKWLCHSKAEMPYLSSHGKVAWKIEFVPVWEGTLDDGLPAARENRMFGDATPGGGMHMLIANPAAADEYVTGHCYVFVSQSTGPQKAYYEGWEHDPVSGKYKHPETGELHEYGEGPGQAAHRRLNPHVYRDADKAE